jgi:hypothetical protein
MMSFGCCRRLIKLLWTKMIKNLVETRENDEDQVEWIKVVLNN